MCLFCLSHSLVQLLYLCPSLDISQDLSKQYKQGCGLARNGNGNGVAMMPFQHRLSLAKVFVLGFWLTLIKFVTDIRKSDEVITNF